LSPATVSSQVSSPSGATGPYSGVLDQITAAQTYNANVKEASLLVTAAIIGGGLASPGIAAMIGAGTLLSTTATAGTLLTPIASKVLLSPVVKSAVGIGVGSYLATGEIPSSPKEILGLGVAYGLGGQLAAAVTGLNILTTSGKEAIGTVGTALSQAADKIEGMADNALTAASDALSDSAGKAATVGAQILDVASDNIIPLTIGAGTLGIIGAGVAASGILDNNSSPPPITASKPASKPRKTKAKSKKVAKAKKKTKHRAVTTKKGRKLKFGSPAWRKKYSKPKAKKRKLPDPTPKTKGVGTEAQFKKKGGKTVYHTKTGQPYIKLADGRARFIKRS